MWFIMLYVQNWEGEPGAIKSVRRDLKSREAQLEELNYARARRFDTKNTRHKSTPSPVLVPAAERGSAESRGGARATSSSSVRSMPTVLKPLLASATPILESGKLPKPKKLSTKKKVIPSTDVVQKVDKKSKKSEGGGRRSSLGKNKIAPH